MKVIINVDLANNTNKEAEDEKELLKARPGCILIEALPTEQKPLGPLEMVSLTWEQRSRPRRKCVTSSGTELALALPRGTQLSADMLLFNAAERTIKVTAEPEEVLVVKPHDQTEMCLIAHHLGNWHRSLQLNSDGTLLFEPDSPLLKWLSHQNISHERRYLPFHPNMKGAAHN